MGEAEQHTAVSGIHFLSAYRPKAEPERGNSFWRENIYIYPKNGKNI